MTIFTVYIPDNTIVLIDKNINKLYTYSTKVIEQLFIRDSAVLISIEKEILYKEILTSVYLKGLPKQNESVINWLKFTMDNREISEDDSASRFEYLESTIELSDRNILKDNIDHNYLHMIIGYIILYIAAIFIICIIMIISDNDIPNTKSNSKMTDKKKENILYQEIPLD